MEVYLFMKWEGYGRKQALEVFYTTTVFIQRDQERRDSSWDSQYVDKIHTRHASHMNKKCKNRQYRPFRNKLKSQYGEW